MPAAFLPKILAVINLLVSGSRSGTEVAVLLVLEQIWSSDYMNERTSGQTVGLLLDAWRPFEGIRVS
jgi:hypothetical protein